MNFIDDDEEKKDFEGYFIDNFAKLIDYPCKYHLYRVI